MLRHGYCFGLALLTMSLASGMAMTAEPTPSTLRVMSFNIRYGTAKDGDNHWDRRKEFVVETIHAFDPDLLGTQENEAFQRDFLAGQLDGYGVFAAGRDDGKDKGESAAIYYKTSRFEKLDGGHFWLSPTPDQVGIKGWDAALPRIATWLKLKDKADPEGKPIYYLNTHFDHRGRQAREESAKLIRSKLLAVAAECRLVVTGDFNAGEGSKPYTQLFAPQDSQDSLVLDTFRQHVPTRGDSEGTYSGFKAESTRGERIDWVACSRDWEVRTAGIDRTSRDGRTPSDHYPVTAVLRPRSSHKTLRVLCYNIHHGRGLDDKVDLPRIARLIRSVDPDFVALQEVDKKTTRTGKVDQAAELARLTGLFEQFGKSLDFQGGEYGQAVLSRFPIEKHAVHTLPGSPDREQRIALEIHAQSHGQPIRFVTTHLHHQDEPTREGQAKKINEVYAQETLPIILAGDMNAAPNSPTITRLKEQWTIATSDPQLLTFPAEKPNRQIDYVLTRGAPNWKVAEARVLDEPVASDHRPVLVVFTLP